jgi:diguanylate cyclase (GGDEF)-like protein
MPELDGSTIILLNGTVAALMFLALRATRRALAQDAPAIGSWSMAYGCFALSSVLYFLRGHASLFLSVTVAGTLLTLGMVLLCRGFYRFQGRDVPLGLVAGAGGAFLAVNGYFTHIDPDYVARVAILSLSGIACYGAILRLYLDGHPRTWRIGEPLTLFAIMTAFLAYSLRLWGAFHSQVDHEASRQLVGDGPWFAAYLLLLNLAQILLANGLLVLTQERVAQKLRDTVSHDALTGALSRSVILDMLGVARASVARNGDRWAVIMIDIDRFKAVNDEHGHTVGDEVLKSVVATMRDHLRLDSHLGRYGGEEFLVVARIRAAGEGRLLAERIRSAVAESVVSTDSGPVRCTLSAGVAEVDPESLDENLDPLDLADRALYDAKRAGRNRVAVATHDEAGAPEANADAAGDLASR